MAKKSTKKKSAKSSSTVSTIKMLAIQNSDGKLLNIQRTAFDKTKNDEHKFIAQFESKMQANEAIKAGFLIPALHGKFPECEIITL
jgi:hypothetical protein